MNFKKYIGPEAKYNYIGGRQFSMLIDMGLLPNHKVLDIGCGSLRIGRFLIMYLDEGNYYGIEPNKWLIDEAILKLGLEEMLFNNRPCFDENDKFDLTVFKKKFDFIIANSILIHAGKQQIEKIFSELPKIMNRDTIFIFNFYEGMLDNHNDDWTYPSKVEYTMETITRLIKQNGLCHEFFEWRYPTNPTWVKVWKKE